MYTEYSERGPVWRATEKVSLFLKCVCSVVIYAVSLVIAAAIVIWGFRAIF